MPRKNKEAYNEYMRQYMANKRHRESEPSKELPRKPIEKNVEAKPEDYKDLGANPFGDTNLEPKETHESQIDRIMSEFGDRVESEFKPSKRVRESGDLDRRDFE
jgi:hypothetical protein